jgi:hypothetical protein
MSWDAIVKEWRGSVPKEAIAEAVAIANRAFVEHSNDYIREFLPCEHTGGHHPVQCEPDAIIPDLRP